MSTPPTPPAQLSGISLDGIDIVDAAAVLRDHTDRIDDLETWRTQQGALVDQLMLGGVTALQDPAPQDAAPQDGQVPEALDQEPELLDLEGLVAWVHTHVSAVIARPLRGEHCWCPWWWEHSEAIFRFEACRRAWEELAGEPGQAWSLWIRDHLDPCLAQLMSPTGPFVDCPQTDRLRETTEHRPLPTLPTAAFDAGGPDEGPDPRW